MNFFIPCCHRNGTVAGGGGGELRRASNKPGVRIVVKIWVLKKKA